MRRTGGFQEHCTLCRVVNSSPEKLPAYDRAIIQTPNVTVIPALGHFIDGYLLICSNRHCYSFGGADAATFEDLVKVKRSVAELLGDVYGKRPLFFEHGPASDRLSAGSCIIHAHMHAIPTVLSVPPKYVTDNLRGTSIDSLEELKRRGQNKQAYFYLECSDGSMFLYDEHILPCQYGRQIVAQHEGLSGDAWDWRSHPFYDRAAETWRKLKEEAQKRHLPC